MDTYLQMNLSNFVVDYPQRMEDISPESKIEFVNYIQYRSVHKLHIVCCQSFEKFLQLILIPKDMCHQLLQQMIVTILHWTVLHLNPGNTV